MAVVNSYIICIIIVLFTGRQKNKYLSNVVGIYNVGICAKYQYYRCRRTK